jgi:hypothetical protein
MASGVYSSKCVNDDTLNVIFIKMDVRGLRPECNLKADLLCMELIVLV